MSIVREVVFARVNRRNKREQTLEMRPFAEDMLHLAESRKLVYDDFRSSNSPKRWFAADLKLTPEENLLSGTFGYLEQQTHRKFDSDSWSWSKGERDQSDTASDESVVPFALDVSDHGRWLAFTTAARMRPNQGRAGFENLLKQAVLDCGLLPLDWEVDLVTSKSSVEQWVTAHPHVFKMFRTLKFSNPGLNLDQDRAEMRELGARMKKETYSAWRGRTLNTKSDDFSRKLDGVERGDVELEMHSRGASGQGKVIFRSEDSPDKVEVEDYGSDLDFGVSLVVSELQRYRSARPRSAKDDV